MTRRIPRPPVGAVHRAVPGGAALVAVLALAHPALAQSLPDGRAYERISPEEKNSAAIYETGGTRQVAADGNAVVFSSSTAFGDSQGSPIIVTYLARRGAEGWRTTAITPPHDPEGMFATSGVYAAFAADLSRGVVPNDRPDLTPGAPQGVRNLYLRDNAASTWSLLTRNAPLGDPFYVPAYADGTPDFSHVLIESLAALTPDAPPGVTNLYVISNDEIRFVGVRPDGTAAMGGSVSGSVPAPNPIGATPKQRTISTDGRRIVFSDLADGQLYQRQNGVRTVHVSRSVRAVADPNGSRPASFQAATDDGGRVFFTSSEQLTDDATTGPLSEGTDLYAFNAETGALVDLTVLDDPAFPNGAEVQGVVAVDGRGQTVYFVARGQLVEGAGAAGAPNLYVRTGDTVRFIGTLDPRDSEYWDRTVVARNDPITPDGGRLTIASFAQLTAAPTGGYQQVYTYDTETGQVRCVSCPRDGSVPTGDAVTRQSIAGNGQLPHRGRVMSADGTRIFFESSDALVQPDTNGRSDVYEDTGGTLRLISTGQSSAPSRLFDASATGGDVVFSTRERLVRGDRDDAVDLYTARIGGGFPEPADPNPECVGSDCQRPRGTEPERPIVGTTTYDQGEERASVPPPTLRVLGANGDGRGITLRLRVSRRGVLIVRGSRVQTLRASIQQSARLRLRWTRDAVRVGRRTGRVRARLTVRFRAAGTSRVVTRSIRIVARFGSSSQGRRNGKAGR